MNRNFKQLSPLNISRTTSYSPDAERSGFQGSPPKILTPKALFNSARNSPMHEKPSVGPMTARNISRYATAKLVLGSLGNNDEFGSPLDKDSPLNKATQNREVAFDLTKPVVQVNSEEKKIESMQRLRNIHKYIREMENIHQKGFGENKTAYTKKEMLGDREKIFDLAQDALLVMNLQVKEISDPLADSAMAIAPAEDRESLANFYYMLIQEVAEFPHAFLSKLKIGLLTICDDVTLFSQSYSKVLNQKMYNGLFVAKQLKTKEAIKEHWYKIILYHLIKTEPTFFAQWKEYFGVINGRKGEMEDMVDTLKCIMQPGKTSKVGLKQAEHKIKLLKNLVKKFEPTYFNEEWWTLKAKEQMS